MVNTLRYIFIRLIWLVFILLFIISLVFISSSLVQRAIWQSRVPFSTHIVTTMDEYTQYIIGIVSRWDWGVNPRGISAWQLMIERAPLSLRITAISFGIALILGILLGIIAARNRGNIIDYIISSATLIFVSIPAFVYIFAIMIIFGWRLEWVPPIYPHWSWATPDVIVLGHIIPIITLSGLPIATFSQLIRSELIEHRDEYHLLLAKTKGLNERQVLLRHSIRNSVLPVIQKMPEVFSIVLFNSFIIEKIYNVPGVARLFFDSIYMPLADSATFLLDPPMIVVITTFYAFIKLSSDLIVDILHSVIDPRITIGYKK